MMPKKPNDDERAWAVVVDSMPAHWCGTETKATPKALHLKARIKDAFLARDKDNAPPGKQGYTVRLNVDAAELRKQAQLVDRVSNIVLEGGIPAYDKEDAELLVGLDEFLYNVRELVEEAGDLSEYTCFNSEVPDGFASHAEAAYAEAIRNTLASDIDFSPEAVAGIKEDVAKFLAACPPQAVKEYEAQLGHDFWLVRNGAMRWRDRPMFWRLWYRELDRADDPFPSLTASIRGGLIHLAGRDDPPPGPPPAPDGSYIVLDDLGD